MMKDIFARSNNKIYRWSQRNLTKGHITSAHTGMQQETPVCTATKYTLPLAHPSPNPKRNLDRFSRFRTSRQSGNCVPIGLLYNVHCRRLETIRLRNTPALK